MFQLLNMFIFHQTEVAVQDIGEKKITKSNYNFNNNNLQTK